VVTPAEGNVDTSFDFLEAFIVFELIARTWNEWTKPNGQARQVMRPHSNIRISLVLTSGDRWRSGWHDEWYFSAGVSAVLLGAHRQTATHQTVEYQLERDADERNLRKLRPQPDRTQQPPLLDYTVPVQCVVIIIIIMEPGGF